MTHRMTALPEVTLSSIDNISAFEVLSVKSNLILYVKVSAI